MAPHGGSPLSSEKLSSLRREIDIFPRRARERGEAYAQSHRVGEIRVGETDIAASVRGDGNTYHTGWALDDDGWSPECDCPVGPTCKHAYALAVTVLRGNNGFEPRSIAAGESRKLVSSDADPSFAALRQLQAATREWEREHALGALLARSPVTLSAYLTPFPEILRERDPELMSWQLAREIRRRAEGWLPPALELYLDRPDLEQLLERRAQSELAVELHTWARQKRRAAHRSLRLVLRLRRDAQGRPMIESEARLTSPRLSDAPRTVAQLNQLRNELRNGTAAIAAEQALLLDWLLDIGAGTYYGVGVAPTRPRALFNLLPNSELIRWGEDLPDAEDKRAGIEPGAIVRYRPEPVRLLPTLMQHGEETVLELRFHWPDGEQRAFDEVVYLRPPQSWSTTPQPSLVFRDGVVWLLAEEPPSALVERFSQARFLPIPEDQRAETIGVLTASFPHMRRSLAEHTRLYDATPVIAMDLRNDDWMQVRLFAHTGGPDWSPNAPQEGVVSFEYAPDQSWDRLHLPPATGAASGSASTAVDDSNRANARGGDKAQVPVVYETMNAPEIIAAATTRAQNAGDDSDSSVWIEEPQPERVSPAIAWLERINAELPPKNDGPAWPDRDTGWWMFVTRKRLARLAEAWEERPSGVGFFGTRTLQRLFSGRSTIQLRLRIVSSGVDWLSVSADWEAEGRRLTDEELAELRTAGSRFVKLSSGWVRQEIVAQHDDMAEILADAGVEISRGEQRVTLWQLAGARSENLEALERFSAGTETIEALHRLRDKIAEFRGLDEVPLPKGLTAELRPYQRHGLDFLAHCSSLGIGAVLADDMGLGKTVEALAWLLHLREREPGAPPSLVVCPASVVHNWAREAERFAPELRVLLLTSGKERHALRKSIGDFDVVVTNYALLRRDIDDWEQIDLHTAILDEAQNIKNPDAAVTRAARALRARHRLALTGTPMENRALDLWSILSFCNPGYLGNRTQFSARYDRADAPPHSRTLLAARMRPVLLRRTKETVAPELPERIEERVDCEMTKGQRQLYLAELRRSRRLIDDLAQAPDELNKNRITILAALTRLRQICCHPALVGGKPSLGSGKFDAVFELLEPLLAEGHKVLVFSQFVECLKRLAEEMRSRELPFHMLTGQTVKRERVVAAFENDPRASVFLISLKAGGTGLNLTSASYVVVFDPWWNPAVEAQAIDRTHRIGQTRTVIAYRLLTRGSIEEKIWELQQRKARLVRDVLGESGFARALTREDLEYLLAVDEVEDA